jgi:hypothetical protein
MSPREDASKNGCIYIDGMRIMSPREDAIIFEGIYIDGMQIMSPRELRIPAGNRLGYPGEAMKAREAAARVRQIEYSSRRAINAWHEAAPVPCGGSTPRVVYRPCMGLYLGYSY